MSNTDFKYARLACPEHVQDHLRNVHFDEVSTFGTNAQRAELSQELLHSASTLIRLSLDYKTRANALLPIARLPREVLLRVFSLVSETQPPHAGIDPFQSDWPDFLPEGTDEVRLEQEGNLQPHPPSLGWIVLSHVSTLWRSLCLGSPALWSKNVGRLPRSIPTFLDRAGSTIPLEICIRQPPQDTNKPHIISFGIFDVIRSDRIQALDCNSRDGHSTQAISDELCSRILPLLRTLKLHFSHLEDDRPTGPRAILHSSTLSSLTTVGPYLPFIAPNLTFLSLGALDYVDGFSGVELLQILAACPLLHTVECSDFSFNDPDEIASTRVHVKLDDLRTLVLEVRNPGEVYVDLLEHFTLPPSAQLELWPDEPEEDEDLALLAYVIRHVWKHEPCTVLMLRDSFIYLYSTLVDYHLGRSRSLIVRCGLPAYISRMGPSLNLQPYFKDITMLCVSPDIHVRDKSPYVLLYATLPNVTHLRVLAGYRDAHREGTSPTRLALHALWTAQGPLPFPRLEEVSIAADVNTRNIVLQNDVLPPLLRRVDHGGTVLKRLDLQCFECPGEFEPITLALGRFVDEIRWKGAHAGAGI